MNKRNPRIQHVWPQYDPWHLPGWLGIHTPHTATDHSLHLSESHRHWLKEEKESEDVTFILKQNCLVRGPYHDSNLSTSAKVLFFTFIQYLVSMHRWHVIIQSNPISDMLRANVTTISWGSSVFCLNVVFHNSSPRLVSAWQTLPLPPTKIGHHFLQVHCKMKTRQLILMECIFIESIHLVTFCEL